MDDQEIEQIYQSRYAPHLFQSTVEFKPPESVLSLPSDLAGKIYQNNTLTSLQSFYSLDCIPEETGSDHVPPSIKDFNSLQETNPILSKKWKKDRLSKAQKDKENVSIAQVNKDELPSETLKDSEIYSNIVNVCDESKKKGNLKRRWPPEPHESKTKEDLLQERNVPTSSGLVMNAVHNLFNETPPQSPRGISRSRSSLLSDHSPSPSFLKVATFNFAVERTPSNISKLSLDAGQKSPRTPDFVGLDFAESTHPSLTNDEETNEMIEIKEEPKEEVKLPQEDEVKIKKSFLRNVEPGSPVGLLAFVTRELSGKSPQQLISKRNFQKTQDENNLPSLPIQKEHGPKSETSPVSSSPSKTKKRKRKKCYEIGTNPFDIEPFSDDQIPPEGEMKKKSSSSRTSPVSSDEAKKSLKSQYSLNTIRNKLKTNWKSESKEELMKPESETSNTESSSVSIELEDLESKEEEEVPEDFWTFTTNVVLPKPKELPTGNKSKWSR